MSGHPNQLFHRRNHRKKRSRSIDSVSRPVSQAFKKVVIAVVIGIVVVMVMDDSHHRINGSEVYGCITNGSSKIEIPAFLSTVQESTDLQLVVPVIC